jgi:hypothetical protein
VQTEVRNKETQIKISFSIGSPFVNFITANINYNIYTKEMRKKVVFIKNNEFDFLYYIFKE